MSDLISREAAIAAIQRLLEKEAFGSAFRVPFLDAIGALQELPSEAVREGDNLYIGRPPVDPPFTVTLDTKLT